MKNKESTSSILDNIRKKMQKIEDKKVSENIDLGDEFEYLDKATQQPDIKKVAKEIINDSKIQPSAEDEGKASEVASSASVLNEVIEETVDSDKKLEENNNSLYDDHSLDNLTEDPLLNSPSLETEGLDDLNLEGDSDHSDDLDLEDLNDLEDHNQDDLDDLDEPKSDNPSKNPSDQPATTDHLEDELLAEEDQHDDFLEETVDENHDDVLNLDEEDKAIDDNGSSSIVNSVYAATANEIISGIKSTDNPQNNMISGKVVEEATSSINKLIEQVSPSNSAPISTEPKASGSKTVEDLVMEILQPKLEQWLNTNLTNIVERIVSEEIKKIIPKK